MLLIDTCGSTGSVVVAEDEEVLATELLPGRSASEQLIPAVRLLLDGRGWRLSDLAAIVVVHGPGSFTGVRIGVSAAKGLSEATDVPLIAVSRLEVLQAMAGGGAVALDAGRGEFYLRVGGVESLATRGELPKTGELALCEMLPEGVGDGLAIRVVAEPVAGDALGIARARHAARQFDNAATLDAHYLRHTEGLYGRAATP